MSDELIGIAPSAVIMPQLPAAHTEQEAIEYQVIAQIHKLLLEFNWDNPTIARGNEIASQVGRLALQLRH